jgi:hypothetical protein
MLQKMLGSMIENDFIKGIKSIATTQNVNENQVQILLTFTGNEDAPIKYDRCINFVSNGEITYQRIMGKSMNPLINEGTILPRLTKSMSNQCEVHNIETDKLRVYLFVVSFDNVEQVGAVIYNGVEKVKITTIYKLLE